MLAAATGKKTEPSGPPPEVTGLDAQTEIIESAGDADGVDFFVWQKGKVVALDYSLGDTGTHEVVASAPAALRRRLVAIDVNGNGTLDLIARVPGGRTWYVADVEAEQSPQ